MKIAKLKLGVLMEHVIQVNERLADDVKCSRFLDAAAADTPIVRELMEQLAILYNSDESDPVVKKGLSAAQRDLVITLALRAIEQESMIPGTVLCSSGCSTSKRKQPC